MKQEQNVKQDLLTKKPFRLMLQLSVPAIIGMVVVGLYPLADGIFAGNIISQQAMTAISVSTPLTLLNTGISTLIGVGSASVLSRAIGKNDKETISKIMDNLLFWIALLSAIITVLGIIFSPYYFDLVNATEEIKGLAIRYIRVIFIGSIFVNFMQSANMLMRGQGLMKKAMLIMGAGALINIILDPILMIAMGDRAIEGAAIATISAQFIQAVITFVHFKSKSETVKIKKVNYDKTISKEVFSVGLSAMLMQVLSIVQQTLYYKQAFIYGSEISGIVMAICMKTQAFSFIPIWGMSQGLQPAVGTNYGAKQYLRVKEIMKTFLISSTVLAAIFWLPSIIFTEKLFVLFGAKDEVLNQGINYFRVFFSSFISYGIVIMTVTYFQSIGDGKTAGLLVMLRQVILFVPMILLMPKFYGNMGIWYSQPLLDVLVLAITVINLSKSYKKDLIIIQEKRK
ncbi:MAG: MATE family efflux transporter [Bacteroidales bacterium]|jgi:putative MATE family efflux protein|nr:MATE family efflux transporter [Bacteroidales bacterium]